MVNEDKSNDKFTWENVWELKRKMLERFVVKNQKTTLFSMNNLLVFHSRKNKQRW